MSNKDSIRNLVGAFSTEMLKSNLGYFMLVAVPEGESGYVVAGNLDTDAVRNALDKVDKRNADKAVSLQHEEQMQR